MDDITGDVLTGINLKNVDLAIPQDKGSICGLNFDFEYDDNVFNVLTNNNGEVVIITDENTLIKDSSKIHATVENGVIHICSNFTIYPLNIITRFCYFVVCIYRNRIFNKSYWIIVK